jgi:hypothetical protein
MATSTTETPVRAGVFATMQGAEQAVSGLLAEGFTKDEITVVCSDESRERWFRTFEHQEPAGSHTPAAAAAGGVIGAALGGFAVLALGAATGGVGLLAAGGLAAWTGGIVGGLVGAMMTRGVEKELANYYDQAVAAGKLLVAVEVQGPRQTARLARAERVLTEAGAEPQPLREG